MLSRLAIQFFVFIFFLNEFVLASPRFNQARSESVSLAQAARRGLNTNAKRMAAGLPPLAPLRRSGTRTAAARRAVASPVSVDSPVTIKDLAGNTLGVLSRTLTDAGHFTVSSQRSNVASFSSSVQASGVTSQLNLLNDQDVLGRYLAVVEPTLSALSTDSGRIAPLGVALASPTGEGPVPGTTRISSASGNSETAIWIYDAAAHTLGVQWVLADGSTPATYLVYNPSTNEVYATLNIAAALSRMSAGSKQVTFSYGP